MANNSNYPKPESIQTRAEYVTQSTWHIVSNIAYLAMREAINHEMRTDEEIAYMTGWSDRRRPTYYDSMGDPNSQVGSTLRAHQQYWNTRLTMAVKDGTPVGYAYSADNASGSWPIRQLKHRDPLQKKNYLWIRGVAVVPEEQGRGIGRLLLQPHLEHASKKQPLTSYTLKDELPDSETWWQQIGLEPTGTQEVYPFGPDTRPSTEVRMQASSVKSVLHMLKR